MTDQNEEYQPRLLGTRFKSLEALENAKTRSDEYINILERQLDEYREDNAKKDEIINSKASMEDLYDQIINARTKPSEQPSQRTEAKTPDIEGIIERKMNAMQRQMQNRSNLDMVRDKIREKFGTNYEESLKKRIEYLDLTQDEADSLAATKPKTFMKMLGLDSSEPFQAPVSNTSMSSTQNATPKRTWTFYQEMKKNSPNEYYAPKTNLQMLEDYRKLGTEFEDGDFKRFGDSLDNR